MLGVQSTFGLVHHMGCDALWKASIKWLCFTILSLITTKWHVSAHDPRGQNFLQL